MNEPDNYDWNRLRALRTKVFNDCTDANWEATKENWRKSEAWLVDKINLTVEQGRFVHLLFYHCEPLK